MDSNATLGLRLERWMRMVGEAGFDGWLVADFRWNNPLFARLLGLQSGLLTRRCFLWLPAYGRGEPHVMGSRIDGHALSGLDCQVTLYSGFEEMAATLRQLLPRDGRVAMEYVEHGILPTVSRVDGGLIDLVRDFGVEVVSSGTLIGSLEIWDQRQRSLHERAARAVDEARRLALRRCGEHLSRKEPVSEGDLARVINSYFADAGMVSGEGPDVAVDANAADPHYSIDDGQGAAINSNCVVLIDLFTRARDAEDAPCADSTWMSYTGPTPPADLVRCFAAVRAAREAAVAAIAQAMAAGTAITGSEVDRVARASLAAAGLAEQFWHRTGHSLGSDHVHGMGANLDSVEFPDDRPLLVGSGFTVEPGVYFPGRFGVRSEVSAILLPEGPYLTTESQAELTLIP